MKNIVTERRLLLRNMKKQLEFLRCIINGEGVGKHNPSRGMLTARGKGKGNFYQRMTEKEKKLSRAPPDRRL